MTLPTYLYANNPPSGNDVPNGIIKSIRDVVGDSNVASYIIPTENRPHSIKTINVNTVIKWDGQRRSYDYTDAYFQIEFKDRYAYPTHYLLKWIKDWYYAKEWYLYGFIEVDQTITFVS